MEKMMIKLNKLNVKSLLSEVHDEMYAKAEKVLKNRIKTVSTKQELYDAIKNGFVAKSCWCGDESHQTELKDKLGAKSVTMPFGEKLFSKTCAFCNKNAEFVVLWAKQY